MLDFHQRGLSQMISRELAVFGGGGGHDCFPTATFLATAVMVITEVAICHSWPFGAAITA
jgi:hypothetical protein